MNEKDDVLNGLDGPLPENTPKKETGYGLPPAQPDLMELLDLRFNFIEAPLQEVFDFVVDFLRKQGKPAVEGDSCTLLAYDGSQCAIGSFFKPEAVNRYLDPLASAESTLAELYQEYGDDRIQEVRYTSMGGYTARFKLLEDLQAAHDEAILDSRPNGIDAWAPAPVRSFVKVAWAYSLDPSKAQVWLAEVEASNG